MKFKLLLVVLVLFLASAACNFGTSSGGSNAVTPAPNDSGNNGSLSGLKVTQENNSGLITSVVMAKNVEGEEKNPVDPTDTFNKEDEVHAVVVIEDAPADTVFKATWYVGDIGNDQTGQVIDSTEITTDGSRNLDFSLSPTNPWPSGSYRFEVSVNGSVDRSVMWFVK